ncbi:aldehyde ferredoxin oxidoreductase [archaeon SCG-AAA382B04]|nr:aldehyde ferredoxin oxidoreductase [archaeon SCG-AAA382B04]
MTDKLLRVSVEKDSVSERDLPESYRDLGGRGLTSMIVTDEVPPKAHSLGPNNKLVLAPGILTGTSAPTSGRLSVGAKSPLTGGVKESNVGTSFGQTLHRLGYRAIVFEDKIKEKDFKYLKIDKDGAKLGDASKWNDMELYEAFEAIHNEFGEDVDVCGVGVAAELGGGNSGLAFDDLENKPSRYAGRGGLGSVLATRGIKFIIVDSQDAPGVEIEDEDEFQRGKEKLANALGEHDVTKPGGSLNAYGTDVLINIINEAGGLPHYNFSKGASEMAKKVSGERKAEIIEERGGDRPHPCSPGCVIQCSENWVQEDGEKVGALEYESVWALGPNCGIFDLDTIGELNKRCNDLGLDTIETGDTIAVLMDAGLLEFSDKQGALELMDEVEQKTALGRIVANGTQYAANAFGLNRAPTVKGQGMPAYDPRAIKGIGVTYATSPMGADHTAGYAIAPEILKVGGKPDPQDTKKGELSRNLQSSTAVIDSTGHCLFIAFAVLDIPEGLEGVVEEVNGVLGADLSVGDIDEIGSTILEAEREFNQKAGISKQEDRVPEFMEEEKVPPTNEVFDVPTEELEKVFK